LATRSGLTRLRINQIKNRRAQPSVGEALLISQALGLSTESIFFLDDTLYSQRAARQEADAMFDALRSQFEADLK